MAGGRPAVRSELVTTYYDTDDRALAERGLVLRVRQCDGSFVQAVKSAGVAGESPLARGEWEDAITGPLPDATAARTGPFLTPDIDGRLAPLFASEVARDTVDLAPLPDTRIEVAIDRGRIVAPGNDRSERISEIEFELKSGEVASLYDTALRLLEIAPLRIEQRSKGERGYRLAAGAAAPIRAAKADLPHLDPALSGDVALQRIGHAALDQILHNERAALAGHADGVHQMRIALRRLRAALSALRTMLPAEQRRHLSHEMRWLAGVLGEARNLDVFVSALIRPAREALPERDAAERNALRQLAVAARQRRRIAYATVRQALRSPRYTALILRLARWFDSRGWADSDAAEDLRRPLGEIAPWVLHRRHRNARKRSKHFARQSYEDRHELRIALKKLRYTGEVLGGLYDSEKVREFTEQLKLLQDDLGAANDLHVGRSLVIALAGGRSRRAATMAAAGKQMLEWHERRLAANEPALRSRLKRAVRSDPFWDS